MVRDADGIVVLTGAGVSAESGVPTFRGPGGLWKEHRSEELATPEAFARDPRLVWEWYAWRRELVARCEPNPGHRALARLALSRDSVKLVTQNVDGLHEVAARNEQPDDVTRALPLELHGSLFRVRCTACGEEYADRTPVDASSTESLPRCRRCGGLLRPAVVWFGEGLPAGVMEAAYAAARDASLCLVAGTSAVVHPAASIPLTTLDGGGEVIEVNPEPTPLSSRASVALRGPAGEVLPCIIEPRSDDP